MQRKAAVLVPIVLIIIAEAMFFNRDASGCLSIHLLNIFICVILAIIVEEISDVFQAFILISLLRVLNIGMPTFFTLTLYWMPFIYGSIIISAYILWRLYYDPSQEVWADGDPIGSLISRSRQALHRVWDFINGAGFGRPPGWKNIYIPASVAISLVLAYMEYYILVPSSLVPDMGIVSLLTLLTVMVVFVGFGEELIFRGFLQSRFEGHYGVIPSIVISAFTFSIMHSGYVNVPYLFFVLFVGFVLAVLYHRTRSLVFVSLIHGFLNFFLFSFLPNGWTISL